MEARSSAPGTERVPGLAARLLGAPASVLAAVGADHLTVIASHGVTATPGMPVSCAPEPCRELRSFSRPFLFADAGPTPLACALKTLTGQTPRGLLGVPLALPGNPLPGVLLAFDSEPRSWSDQNIADLQDLAALVSAGSARSISEITSEHPDLLLESIGEGVYSIDLQGICRYINQTGAHLLGYEPGEIVGRVMHDLVHHSYPDGTPMPGEECPTGTAMRTGESISVSDQIFRRKDGTHLPVELTVSPVVNRGEVTGAVVNFVDITERKRAEQDIRLFKDAVDSVGQAVIITDLAGKVTYWNQAAEHIYGWRADEVIGRPVTGITPAAESGEQAREIMSALQSGKSWSGEFNLRRKDGSQFTAIVTDAPLHNEDGALVGIIGVTTDISETKAAESEIRFFKHVVDAVGQAVVANDNSPERRITYWNQAAERLLGWTAEEAIGRGFYETVPDPDFWPDVRAIGKLAREGEPWQGEFRMRHRDGTIIPAIASVAPILDDDGELLGVISVYTDTTEIKRHERDIRFYKHVVEAVGQVVIANDLDRNVTYWNKAAEEVLGWAAEEVVGRDAAGVAPAGEFLPNIPEITRIVRSGQTWTGEFLMQHRDGTVIPALSTIKPIFDESEALIGVLGAHTDIRELKRTEQQLRVHKDMLDAVGQAVLATDEALRITYWNRAAEELYGYAADEAIGMYLLDLLPHGSDGFHQAVNAIEALAREGSWTGEITNYHKDGTEVTVLASATPILNDAGEQVGLIAAMADITERRQTEEALVESNEQIIEILETMGDGFLSINRDWRITYVNQQGERFLRKTREELLGRDIWEQFPGADQRAFFSEYAQALNTGCSVDFTEYYPELDAWFEVHAFPSSGQLSIFFRDVTQRIAQENALREAEQRYRTLVEQLPAVTYIAAPDDIADIRYVSPQIERMLGYTPDEWLSRPTYWMTLLHPDDRETVAREDTLTNSSRESFTLEYRQRTRYGDYRWIRDSATLIRDEEGTPKYWQGLSHDITDEKTAERQIHESEQRFRSLFDHHPDAVFSIDRGGRVLTANPAFVDLTGRDPAESGTLQFVDLVVPDDRDRVYMRFGQTHQGQSQAFHAAIINRHGERAALSITTIPIIVDGEIVGVHVVAQDVTVHQELENQLAHQAYHDPLTGLPNRSLFQARLTGRIDRASGGSDRFAVLFFDLDDFKIINDSLGHSAGDQLLIQVAERVQTCIRDDDVLARLGGDEFTLLLERADDERDAILIAERIARVLDDSFIIEGHEVFVTTSIGIALADPGSTWADDVLRNADMAMYEAKNSGKNRYAIFEPSMNSRAWLRLMLETDLRRAIDRNELEVYYQPIIDLNTGDLDGVEALVRWNHPERGLLLPDEFIAAAEQSGLILPLGQQVVEQATTQLQSWQSLQPERRPIRLNLNLSSKQYQHPRLAEEITALIERSSVDPGLITMEITESIAMDDSDNTLATLQRLKDIGVHLALDDFGTGFSALGCLRRFPIDILKIDQTFVDGLGRDPEDTSIVEAVMAASLAMNLRVTAEGIETMDQLARLRALGCHLGQGYLISPPLSVDQMRDLMARETFPWRASMCIQPDSVADEANH